ncbi:MAG: hypothetical protein NXH75_13015 [Halobacteriovoraceae bacterium]|nr:hypothetical protein [Halobacteriovoraceae bacterium]
MILEIQRKMMKTGMEWTEKGLENLYKDKSFLQFSSVGLNMNMWMQKTYGKGLGWIFKTNPDDANLAALHESLHALEKENHEYETRIKGLESTIDDLHKKLKVAEAKAPKKVAPQRTSKARTGVRRKTTDTVM